MMTTQSSRVCRSSRFTGVSIAFHAESTCCWRCGSRRIGIGKSSGPQPENRKSEMTSQQDRMAPSVSGFSAQRVQKVQKLFSRGEHFLQIQNETGEMVGCMPLRRLQNFLLPLATPPG